MEETELALAETLFYLACQKPLSRQDTEQLVSWLKDVEKLTPTSLAVLMSFLYSIDVSALEACEDLDGKQGEEYQRVRIILRDMLTLRTLNRIVLSLSPPGFHCMSSSHNFNLLPLHSKPQAA